MNGNKNLVMIAVVIVIAFAISGAPSFKIITSGGWDISAKVTSKGYEMYLKEEADFDYSSRNVYDVAYDIKSRTRTPKQAIRETLDFVVHNVRYSSSISVNECYDEKASTILEIGKGDCVSMSRLTTALLRAQGIPARTMGGCLSIKTRCTPLFAAVPFLEARVTEMIEDDFKKRGYLHEWVEAFDGEKWYLLESTSGQVFDLTPQCGAYINFGYDSNRFNRCVISDSGFWNLCQNS